MGVGRMSLHEGMRYKSRGKTYEIIDATSNDFYRVKRVGRKSVTRWVTREHLNRAFGMNDNYFDNPLRWR